METGAQWPTSRCQLTITACHGAGGPVVEFPLVLAPLQGHVLAVHRVLVRHRRIGVVFVGIQLHARVNSVVK